MRTAAILALLASLDAASAQVAVGGLNGNVSYPIVQLTNRTFVPTSLIAPGIATQWMSLTYATTRLAVTSLQVSFPGFYNVTEVAVPGTANVTASIEYPPGTCHQLLFGGSATGTIPAGGSLLSDGLTLAIPVNTVIGIRRYDTNASGIMTTQFVQDSTHGERAHYGTSGISDQTVSCDAVTNTAGGQTTYAAAIVGPSPVLQPRSICIWGDSRAQGVQDPASVQGGDQGDVARSLTNLPYINLSIQGETAANGPGIGTHGAGRLSYAKYCTSVISEMGYNDVEGGATWAATLTKLQSAYAAFGLPVWQTTMQPGMASTDSFATPTICANAPGNQTPINAAGMTQLGIGNTAILAGIAGTFGTFDISSPVTCNYTTSTPVWLSGMVYSDGVHENGTGDAAIAASGNVNPAVLH